MNSFSYTVDNTIILKKDQKTMSNVDKGNTLQFLADGNNVKLILDNKTYSSKFFQIYLKMKELLELVINPIKAPYVLLPKIIRFRS